MTLETDGGAGDPGEAIGDQGAGGDGGAGGSGDGGGAGDPGPVDLDSIAAEVDAQLAAELGVGGDGDGADGEGEGGAEEGSRGRGGREGDVVLPAAVKQYIDKNYKGDTNAFLEAQYESRSESKRLAEENRQLRERLESGDKDPQRGDPAKVFEAARQQSSEVRALDQEITTIDGRLKATQQSMMTVVKDAQTEQNEISKLEGQLTDTDEQAKIFAIRAQIGSKRARLETLQTRFDNLESRQGDLALLRTRAVRELASAERSLRESMDQERSARSRGRANADRINTSFDVTFKAAAANLDVDPEGRTYGALRETVRLSVSDYLIGLGEDHPPLDPMELRDVYVKAISDFASAFNIKSKTKTSSGPKPKPRPVFRPPVARGGNGGDRGAPKVDHEKDPNYWRRRADGIGKALARGSR